MADYRDRIGKSKDKQTGFIPDSIGGVADDATDAIGNVSDSVSDTVSDATDSVSDTVSDSVSGISSPSIPDVGDTVSDTVDDATDAVGDVTDDIEVPDFEAPEINVPEVEVPDVDVPEIDVPDVDVPEIYGPDIDAPDIGSAFDDATEVFDSAQEDISGAFDDTVSDSVDNISSTFDDAFSDVSDSTSDVFDDTVSTIDESASSVFDDATSATDGIFEDVQEGVSEIGDTAEDAFDSAQEGAENIFEDVDDTIGDQVEGISDFTDDTFDGIGDTFDGATDQFDDTIGDVGDTIDDIQEDPLGDFSESVSNVSNTVSDFIGDTQWSVGSDDILGGGLPQGVVVNPDLGADLIEGIRNQQIPTAQQLWDVASYGAIDAVQDLADASGISERINDVSLPSVNLPSAEQILSGLAGGVKNAALANPFGFALQQLSNGNIQEFADGLNAAILGNNGKSEGGQFSADENPYGNDGGYAWGEMETAKELEGCVIMKQEAQESNATRYFTVSPVQDSEMLRVIGPSQTVRVTEDSFSDPDSLPYWMGETTEGRSAYDLAIEACPGYDTQEQGDPEDRYDGPRDEHERENGKEGSWSNDLTPVEETERCVVLEQPNSNGSIRYLTAGQESGTDVIYQPDGSAVPVNENLEWSSIEGAQTVDEAITYCPGYEEEEPPLEERPADGEEPPSDEEPTDGEEPPEGDDGAETDWGEPEEVRTTDGGCVIFRQLDNSGGSRYFTFTESDGVLVAVDDSGNTTPVQEGDTNFDGIPSFNRISSAESACAELPRNQGEEEEEEEPQEEQWQEPTVAAETGRCVILAQESNEGNSRYFTITKIEGQRVAMVPGSGEAVTLSGDESFSEIPSFTTLQAAQDACPTQGEKPTDEEIEDEIENRDPDDTSGSGDLGLGGISPTRAIGGLALLGAGAAVILKDDEDQYGMSSMETGNDEGLFEDDSSPEEGRDNNNDSSGNGPGQSLFGE